MRQVPISLASWPATFRRFIHSTVFHSTVLRVTTAALVAALIVPAISFAAVSDRQDEIAVRTEASLGGGWEHPDWLETDSSVFIDLRSPGHFDTLDGAQVHYKRKHMAATFVAEQDATQVAISFSAEAYTTAANKRLFVRALVDGQPAAPADVVFATGPFIGTRSFTFSTTVDEGVHNVHIQWLVDRGATAGIRDAALKIRVGEGDGDDSLTVLTPPSGPADTTQLAAWQPIPGTATSVFVPAAGGTVTASFSGESVVTNGKRFFLRAILDGSPMEPGDVIFTSAGRIQSRTMTFGVSGLAPGLYPVHMEWLVDDGGTATLGDRTLVLASHGANGTAIGGVTHLFDVAPPGATVKTSDSAYQPIPDLSGIVLLPENAEISVVLSAETWVSAGGALRVRLNVGGGIAESEVVLSMDDNIGVHSFVFDAKHLNLSGAPGQLQGVWVDWAYDGAGTAVLGDRSLEIVVEPGAYPDLAEAPRHGYGNIIDGGDVNVSGVEPVHRTQELLTILWDPHRGGMPAAPLVDFSNALFGAHSVSDYFDQTSRQRLTIQNEGMLGWFDAIFPWSHYANHSGCGGIDVFTGGLQKRYYEALLGADNAGFDFAAYDHDQDGVVEPEELAILIVMPGDPGQQEVSKTRHLTPFCDGSPAIFDGVQIPAVSDWLTLDPQGEWANAAHELSHLTMELPDMYIDNVNIATEPERMSLMGNAVISTSYLDAANRLGLGWARPRQVVSSGWITLEDVRLTDDVVVLPRRGGGSGKEYFLLETRLHRVNDALYDEKILSSGLFIWHVIEDVIEDPVLAMTPYQCQAAPAGADNARHGIRLMRPGINNPGLVSSDGWGSDDYNLLDSGLVCPGGSDDPRNALLWADGTASGYSIGGLFEDGADAMTFYVAAP